MILDKDYTNLIQTDNKDLKKLEMSIELKMSPQILYWSNCVIVRLHGDSLYLIKNYQGNDVSTLDFEEKQLTDCVSENCMRQSNVIVDMTRYRVNSDNILELVNNKQSDLCDKILSVINDNKVIEITDVTQETELYKLLDSYGIRWRSGAYLYETVCNFRVKYPIYIAKKPNKDYKDSSDKLAILSWSDYKYGNVVSYSDLVNSIK